MLANYALLSCNWWALSYLSIIVFPLLPTCSFSYCIQRQKHIVLVAYPDSDAFLWSFRRQLICGYTLNWTQDCFHELSTSNILLHRPPPPPNMKQAYILNEVFALRDTYNLYTTKHISLIDLTMKIIHFRHLRYGQLKTTNQKCAPKWLQAIWNSSAQIREIKKLQAKYLSTIC